jgi:hypothetical protein
MHRKAATIVVWLFIVAPPPSGEATQINGRILFSGYQSAFNDERRAIVMTAQAGSNSDRYNGTVDEQGFFTIEVPSNPKAFKVAWESTRQNTAYAIYPVEHPLLDATQFHKEFRFRPLADLHVDKRDQAGLLVRRGDFGPADEIVQQMLKIYSVTGTQQARTWRFKFMQQICGEVTNYQKGLGGRDLRDDLVKKARNWWQEHVVAATAVSPLEGARALNGWAAFATSAYSPGGQQWPDESYKRVPLRKNAYRELLRDDLDFVREQLNRPEMSDFITKVRTPPRGPARPPTDREKALAFYKPISTGYLDAVSLLTVMRFLSAIVA